MDSKRLAEIADVMEDRGLTRVRVEEPDGTAVELRLPRLCPPHRNLPRRHLPPRRSPRA